MDPVFSLHLSDKHALAEDSSDEVECERGGVLPITRHHAPDSNFLPTRKGIGKASISFCHEEAVFETALNRHSNLVQVRRNFGVGVLLEISGKTSQEKHIWEEDFRLPRETYGRLGNAIYRE
jgi:hypothetical protein